jgi:SAM-dependent methyltransferase/uncharacterized protein YbaR (Trm112 family)
MTELRTHSAAMRLARRLGMERLAWSLRRLHCPVERGALVLEVGSGGNPYARANVLLDAYPETRERHWVPLTVDRPFVFGFLEKLPFKDKSFDYVIASHVLEHSPAPDRALAEMQRVGRAGYIEVPDALMERINPYKDHRAEITVRDARLLVRKKPAWMVDPELVELYEAHVKPLFTGQFIPSRPFAFHVRHFWSDRLDYVVLNAGADSTWVAPDFARPAPVPPKGVNVRDSARRLVRGVMSQSWRNRRIDLTSLLACPTCSHSSLVREEGLFTCEACSTRYPDRDHLPMLYPASR